MEFEKIKIIQYDCFTNEIIDVTNTYMKYCTCGEINYDLDKVFISTTFFDIHLGMHEFICIEYTDKGNYSYTINGKQSTTPISKKGLISIKCADEALKTFIEREALDVFDDGDKVKIKLKDNRVIEILKSHFEAIEWYDTQFKKYTIQGYVKTNMMLCYVVMIKGSGVVIFAQDKDRLLNIIDKNSSIYQNIIVRSFYKDQDLSNNIYKCITKFFREEFESIMKYTIDNYNDFRIEKLLPIKNLTFNYPNFIRMDDNDIFLGRIFFDGKDWRK